MQDNPKYSIIIPTLNEQVYLPRLLRSLLKQTYTQFEVIVVDGASKDNTVKNARAFENKFSSLRVIVSKVAGVSRQRNLGAKAARSEWLVFVDADSVLLPHALSRIDAYITSHRAELVTSWLRVDSNRPIDALAVLIGNMALEGYVLLNLPWAPGPLTVIHYPAFRKAGGYNEAMSFGEDQDLAMRLKSKGVELHIIREILYEFSMRRYRNEGTLTALRTYVIGGILFLSNRKKPPKTVPGFVGGGQLYSEKLEELKKPVLKDFEQKFTQFMKELKELFEE